jgi:hypothetical protein
MFVCDLKGVKITIFFLLAIGSPDLYLFKIGTMITVISILDIIRPCLRKVSCKHTHSVP